MFVQSSLELKVFAYAIFKNEDTGFVNIVADNWLLMHAACLSLSKIAMQALLKQMSCQCFCK